MFRAKEAGRRRGLRRGHARRGSTTAASDGARALRRAIGAQRARAALPAGGRARRPGLVGFEALLRWRHPERGLLSPVEFIPLAEETGLIVPHRRAGCSRRPAARSPRGSDARPGRPRVAREPLGAPARATAAWRRRRRSPADAGAGARGLALEITETALHGRRRARSRRWAELTDLGVQLALDDFGTGYSSLSYLQRFPVDILKIDRSFVHGDGRRRRTPRSSRLISLADGLGLEVVAEGVETPSSSTCCGPSAASGPGLPGHRPSRRSGLARAPCSASWAPVPNVDPVPAGR